MRVPAASAVTLAALVLGTPAAQAKPSIASFVKVFGNNAVQNGSTPGLEVAVVVGAAKPAYYSFGVTNVPGGAKPDANTLFQIASVTKVFTTNLLGQAVNAKTLALDTRLSSLAAQLGTLPADTGLVTLQDLADFTGGFPSLAAECTGSEKPAKTGCLPGTIRPALAQYGAADFAAFFRTYTTAGVPPLSYFYSDFSLGLVGLLLGAKADAPLSNAAFTGWDLLLKTDLLKPLKMKSTFLNVPTATLPRLAPGYAIAQATAAVSNGGISSLLLTDAGNYYAAAPAVTISGGGGSGATATARVTNGFVTGLTVANAGTGYTAPAAVTFSSGTATGRAIISDGHVTGVSLVSPGSYTSAPTVTFSGGRVHGHDATGTVYVDHDLVTYVQITDPGAGYVDPVTVSIAPGAPSSLTVPIWAPAGALKSSAHDLATFAAAALGHTTIGTIKVPPAITAGFAIAETPYACEQGSPSLSGCASPRSGLAWDIMVTTPETITKDGALPGYSSFVLLLPAQDTAVIVLSNDYSATGPAARLGAEIASALYHNALLPGAHPAP